MTQTRKWVIGTGVLCVLVLVATWFLVVTPKMNEAADTRDQNDAALSEQDQLRTTLTQLKAQFEDIESYKSQLDLLRTQIPESPELASFIQQVNDGAAAAGVTILSLQPQEAQSFADALGTNPAVTQAEGEGTGTGTATDGSTPAPTTAPSDTATTSAQDTANTANDAATATGGTTSTPAPTPAAAAIPPVLTPLVVVPVNITIQATYPAALAFVEWVQTVNPRLFLVAGFDTVSLDQLDAVNGHPAAAPGDVEMTLSGLIYSYEASTTGTVPPADGDDGAGATPPPLPVTERNPYASVTG